MFFSFLATIKDNGLAVEGSCASKIMLTLAPNCSARLTESIGGKSHTFGAFLFRPHSRAETLNIQTHSDSDSQHSTVIVTAVWEAGL